MAEDPAGNAKVPTLYQTRLVVPMLDSNTSSDPAPPLAHAFAIRAAPCTGSACFSSLSARAAAIRSNCTCYAILFTEAHSPAVHHVLLSPLMEKQLSTYDLGLSLCLMVSV